jgi:hypothetical protein
MQDCGVLDFDGAAGDHLFLCDARLEAEPAPAAPRRDAGGAP